MFGYTFRNLTLILSRGVWLLVPRWVSALSPSPSVAHGNPRWCRVLCDGCTWIKVLCVVFLRSVRGWRAPYPPPLFVQWPRNGLWSHAACFQGFNRTLFSCCACADLQKWTAVAHVDWMLLELVCSAWSSPTKAVLQMFVGRDQFSSQNHEAR